MASDFLREIAGPAGPLEALLDVPAGDPRAVAVFGHPHPLHGGTMHTKALYQTAQGNVAPAPGWTTATTVRRPRPSGIRNAM